MLFSHMPCVQFVHLSFTVGKELKLFFSWPTNLTILTMQTTNQPANQPTNQSINQKINTSIFIFLSHDHIILSFHISFLDSF